MESPVKQLEENEIIDGGVEYKDIFSKNVNKQKVITVLYMTLFKIRKDLIETQNGQSARAPLTKS